MPPKKDKGGCKVGKKESKGGCKEGKKKVAPKRKKMKVAPKAVQDFANWSGLGQ